jgi:splicing factor 3A subunit 2
MSAYEQRKEVPDKRWQYILFAAEPYETIAFKIPSKEADTSDGKLLHRWDSVSGTYLVQVYFKEPLGAPVEQPGRNNE